MSEAVVAKIGLCAGKSLLSYLAAKLDPNMRRQLDEEITLHVLSEIPRIKRLLEERIDDVAASGCTPHEANIIAHQVIEAQQRTLDEDKRRRLSNVLLNGLRVEHWDKARHRLIVRLASELEEEHVECLQHAWTRRRATGAVQRAIERELFSRGLLDEESKEIPNPRWRAPAVDGQGRKLRQAGLLQEHVPEFIDEKSVRISDLGREFLDHLRDPEAPEPNGPRNRRRARPEEASK